jgi:hypothetical protein
MAMTKTVVTLTEAEVVALAAKLKAGRKITKAETARVFMSVRFGTIDIMSEEHDIIMDAIEAAI